MKIDDFEIQAIKDLGFANISQLLLSYCGLKKENEDMKRTIELFSNSLYNADLKRYKSVLDEIRERATIRLTRLENEPDYCKWFLEGYDRAITVNKVSNSGVAMEWVKNTMITECKEVLQILDKAGSNE